MEKREPDSGRVESNRVESSRMEKEGGLEEQADSCGRRETETEDRWSNETVYIYIHSAAGKSEMKEPEGTEEE